MWPTWDLMIKARQLHSSTHISDKEFVSFVSSVERRILANELLPRAKRMRQSCEGLVGGLGADHPWG